MVSLDPGVLNGYPVGVHYNAFECSAAAAEIMVHHSRLFKFMHSSCAILYVTLHHKTTEKSPDMDF